MKTTVTDSFVMSVEEIRRWQKSYAVYADAAQKGMSKEFIRNALQGHSKSGTEAFLLKFVVRISQCPILMEFDDRMSRHDPSGSW